MAIVKFTPEKMLCGPLDEEQNELMMWLAELDSPDRNLYQSHTYLRSLIDKRLREIEDVRTRLNLPKFNPIPHYHEIAAIETQQRAGNDGHLPPTI